LINHDKYTELILWHNAIEFFDYNPAIDWAMRFIEQGKETENILIVASFSKPVDSYEIKPYVSGAIKELNLEEKYGKYSTIANAHYHLELILESHETRLNLRGLYKLCNNTNHEFGLTTFYLLYHAWSDLEEEGYNFYYEGATLENIDEKLKEEARIWIDKYILGKDEVILREDESNGLNEVKDDKIGKRSMWIWIKRFLKKR